MKKLVWIFFLAPNFYKFDHPDVKDQPDEIPYGVLFSLESDSIPTLSQKSVYVSRVFDNPAHARLVYQESIEIIRTSFTPEVECSDEK